MYIKSLIKYTRFFRGSHSCGTLTGLFLLESKLHIMEIGLHGTFFGQATRKFLLELSNKGTVEYSIPITLTSFRVRKSQ